MFFIYFVIAYRRDFSYGSKMLLFKYIQIKEDKSRVRNSGTNSSNVCQNERSHLT